MCYVRICNDIRTEQDVQNLITAIVLRQKDKYTRPYLIKATKHYLPDPTVRVVVDEKKIKEMIDNTLMVLRKNGKVRCQVGTFYPVNGRIEKLAR